MDLSQLLEEMEASCKKQKATAALLLENGWEVENDRERWAFTYPEAHEPHVYATLYRDHAFVHFVFDNPPEEVFADVPYSNVGLLARLRDLVMLLQGSAKGQYLAKVYLERTAKDGKDEGKPSQADREMA